VADPLRGSVVTRYLVRAWPAGDEAPAFRKCEMQSPDSVAEREGGNDKAMVRATRNWAQASANAGQVPYAWQVRRDSVVAGLDGPGAFRDNAMLADEIAEPGGTVSLWPS
jgi:hypothetical protein